MNKTLDMNKILEDMLNTSLSNCILSQLQEGNLVEDDATIYILYDKNNNLYIQNNKNQEKFSWPLFLI